MRTFITLIIFIFLIISCQNESNEESLNSGDRAFFHFNLCKNEFIINVFDVIAEKNLNSVEIEKAIEATISKIDSLYDVIDFKIVITNVSDTEYWKYNLNTFPLNPDKSQYHENHFPYYDWENRPFYKHKVTGGIATIITTDKEVYYFDINRIYKNQMEFDLSIYFIGKENIDFDNVYTKDSMALRNNEVGLCIKELDWDKIIQKN